MSDFTYEFPDRQQFVYTLRQFLESTGKDQLALLLIGAECDFASYGQFSRVRWNSYEASITFRVLVKNLGKFDDDTKKTFLEVSSRLMPLEAGYELQFIDVIPIFVSPPTDEIATPLNSASLVSEGTIEHDGLRFRSKTETKIYDALKKRHVLFFANSTAILGAKNVKREPDFLICQDGKWGILEVMGNKYHTNTNAMQDHDRARLFKDYGLVCIEFYDGVDCYNRPDWVVEDFLKRLGKV